MRRRDLLALAAGAAALRPLAGAAQGGGGPLIGLLRLAPGDPTEAFVAASRRQGSTLRFLVLSAEGGLEPLSRAAAELVARKADLIIVFGDPAIRAAQAATATIPIVGMTDDMLGSALVRTMARPGSNTTGVSIFASELDVKRFELLHEISPQSMNIGVLADYTTVSSRASLEQAARKHGITLTVFGVRQRSEIGGAIDALTSAGVEAVNVLASPLLWTERAQIIERLNRARLPAIYQWPEGAVEGGLLGYGPGPITASYQLVTALAEKILRGAKPADLPVQQPTRFELVINLKTAHALGLAVPPSLLARADEIIE